MPAPANIASRLVVVCLVPSYLRSTNLRSLGGKKFSRNLTPLDKDGNPVGMWGV